jgi:UDP:flavonoid glycosyltransferase YjiC (YdhE family)
MITIFEPRKASSPWRPSSRPMPDAFQPPSVVEQSTLFIHHGGNSSFCEALYFGVPSLVMPFRWDGHDNARRAEDAGAGQRIDRYRWTDGELATAIAGLLDNSSLNDTLAAKSVTMKKAAGVTVAAKAILDLI